MPDPTSLLYTKRDELDGTLNLLEGRWPEGLHGSFYVIYPVGSVTSGGLPLAPSDPDYGSPIMNGDGLVLKVDLGAGPKAPYKTRLMKTPCYWADAAPKAGLPLGDLWKFRDFGISRMSGVLGARNLLNTAVTPVTFGQKGAFLLASYDVGRPFVLDPLTLELGTPVGQTGEWSEAQPGLVPWPFAVDQTTAHPVFDARTREWFTVSYNGAKPGHSVEQIVQHQLQNDPEGFKLTLGNLAEKHRDNLYSEAAAQDVHKLFIHFAEQAKPAAAEPAGTKVALNLFRWTGAELEKWALLDQNGQPLVINECLHQIGLTKDYLILTDCAFKFSLDLLFSNPVPGVPLIDELLRAAFSKPMEPSTTTYVVRRRDLRPGGGAATAWLVTPAIPLETIHYSCEYENPQGKITLVGVHNAATCVAEWLRPFDKNKLTGKPVDPEVVGLFALGSMDASRLGRWVIDAERAVLDTAASATFASAGNLSGPEVGPNTWTIGLYTFRDMISPDKTTPRLNQLFYISAGTDDRMLSDFIFNLYRNYPNRLVPVDQVLQANRANLPFCLTRLDINTMQPADHFQAPPATYLRGTHFVPSAPPRAGLDPELDGWLFCPVHRALDPAQPSRGYTSEFWIFDASDLKAGPVARLGSPDLRFAFTLHTAWLENPRSPELDYNVNIVQDYTDRINSLELKIDRGILLNFFNQYVFPHYPRS